MTKTTGKFIVIDGTDGSGKGTQTRLLVEKLEYAGYNVELADFPQYGKKSAGMVEKYLNGAYGNAHEVGPYRASVFFAVDASFQIKKWLNEGKIVISNRYVTANMGHQGGKIKNSEERKKYLDWLYKLEYEIFNIPKPDLNIILHVDAAIAQKLIDQKEEREYLHGAKRDIHEADINHLRDAEQVYLEIAKTFPDFELIKCTKEGNILTREEINYMLWEKVAHLINSNGNHPIYINYKHLKNIEKDIENRHNSFVEKVKKISNYSAYYTNQNIKHKKQTTEKILGNSDFPHLKIERVSSIAKLPTRAYKHDIGYDIYSVEFHSLVPGEQYIVRTGIKMEMPNGFAGLVWDKSGVAKDGVHVLGGVYDPGYRGEVTVTVRNLGDEIYHIAPGQKIAQLLFHKVELPEIIEDKVNENTERGAGRHGSSGLF